VEYNRRAYLNELLDKPAPTHTGKVGRKGKSGRQQVNDNGAQIKDNATAKPNAIAELLGMGPCLESTASLNHQGRPLKSIKWQLPNGEYQKRDFFAYHVTWVAEYGRIPDPRFSYSHRCHNALCVEPRHGLWERLVDNSARNICVNNSHLMLPNDAIVRWCPHSPECCSPRVLADWGHEIVLRAPKGI
jgi:Zinc-binding loop region of homing endonuclease